MNYLVSSFIAIALCVSDGRAVCDEDTTINDLLSDDFDVLDFELAICCFEATHRIELTLPKHDCGQLSIHEFIEKCAGTREQTAPLFVTERFMFFKRALEQAIRDRMD